MTEKNSDCFGNSPRWARNRVAISTMNPTSRASLISLTSVANRWIRSFTKQSKVHIEKSKGRLIGFFFKPIPNNWWEAGIVPDDLAGHVAHGQGSSHSLANSKACDALGNVNDGQRAVGVRGETPCRSTRKRLPAPPSHGAPRGPVDIRSSGKARIL